MLAALALLACERAAVADALERWAAPIGEASSRFSIPEAWIRRVIQIESNGRQRVDGRPVVSRAGAKGLTQLMPATWRDLRALLNLGIDPQDPHDNILAGSFYLRLLYERFGYPGLFVAYNAGPSRYSAFLAGARRLPPETVAYVRRAGAVASAPQPARSLLFRQVEGVEAVGPPTRGGAGPAVSAASLGSRSGGLFVPLTGSGTAP